VLKSFWRDAGTVAAKETVPNTSLSCGPHEMISPLFRSSELIGEIFVLSGLLQRIDSRNKTNKTRLLIEKKYEQI
jgi:hypothetical protein